MKKLGFIIVLAFLLVFTGCAREDQIDITGNENLVFYIGSDLSELENQINITGVNDKDVSIQIDTTSVKEYVTGFYQVTFFVYENDNIIYQESGNIEITDIPQTDTPEINFARDFVYVIGNPVPDFMMGITATDRNDGSITDDINVDFEDVDLSTEGIYQVYYSVVNNSGLIGRKSIRVHVIENEVFDLTTEFFIVSRFGKEGIIDTDNNIIFPINFDNIQYMKNDVIKIEYDDMYFYYNFTDNVYFTSQYEIVKPFSNSVALAKDIFGNYGYVDTLGNKVLDFLYDEAYSFSNDMAIVSHNNTFGIIDTTGTFLVDNIYDTLKPLGNGLYKGSKLDLEEILTIDGTELFEANHIFYEKEKPLYQFEMNGKYGVIDNEYNIIITPDYNKITINEDIITLYKDDELMDLYCDNSKNIIEDVTNYTLSNNNIIYATQNGFGVADIELEILIPSSYIRLEQISENYFVVENDEFLYGVVDKENNTVLDFLHPSYHENKGLYVFRNQNDLDILVDNEGNILTDKSYQSISEFKEGYSVVKHNDLFGMIDTKGNLVLDTTYHNLTSFENGYSRTYTSNQVNDSAWGVIDKEFNTIIENRYAFIGKMSDNIFSVIEDYSNSNSAGYINTNGDIILDLVYSHSYPFSNGFGRIVENDGYYRLVDVNGMIISSTYNHIDAYKDDYFLAQLSSNQDSKCLLDTSGKVVTDCIYKDIHPFYDGIASVITTDGANYINMSNELLLDKSVNHTSDFMNGFGLLYNENNLYDVIDTEGNYILRNQEHINIGDDLFRVRNNNLIGFYDFEGHIVVDFIYKYATEFNNGYAFVCIEESSRCGVIDSNMNEVLPLNYELVRTHNTGVFVNNLNHEYKLSFTEEGFIKEIEDTNFKFVYDNGFRNMYTDVLFDYYDITYFNNRSFMIHQDEHVGLVDLENNEIIHPNYHSFTESSCRSFYLVYSNGLVGLVKDNESIIPTLYQEILQIQNGEYYIVSSDILKGVYNKEGYVKIPVMYDEITYYKR